MKLNAGIFISAIEKSDTNIYYYKYGSLYDLYVLSKKNEVALIGSVSYDELKKLKSACQNFIATKCPFQTN